MSMILADIQVYDHLGHKLPLANFEIVKDPSRGLLVIARLQPPEVDGIPAGAIPVSMEGDWTLRHMWQHQKNESVLRKFEKARDTTAFMRRVNEEARGAMANWWTQYTLVT